MPDQSVYNFDLDKKLIEVVPVHYDVLEHHIPLDQFISTANSTTQIIENFNRELFDGKLKYEVRVVPPKDGTFLEILGIAIAVPGSALTFMGTEIGKEFVFKLTGQYPIYWAGEAGTKLKKYFESESFKNQISAVKEISADILRASPKHLLTHDAEKGVEIATSKDVPIRPLQKIKQIKMKKFPDFQLGPTLDHQKATLAIIVAKMTSSFLEKRHEDLSQIGFSRVKYREAYSARNKIYEDCIGNKDIKGIGFDTSSNFPIRRKDFPRYIVDIPPPEKKEQKLSWSVAITDIKVNSPNWKRDGRKWQAECDSDKEVAFSLEDDVFWHHVKIKDIVPDINDSMKVQWIYPAGCKKLTNVHVLKVLSYNGKEISKPLSDDELKIILQEYVVVENEQEDLFNVKT